MTALLFCLMILYLNIVYSLLPIIFEYIGSKLKFVVDI